MSLIDRRGWCFYSEVMNIRIAKKPVLLVVAAALLVSGCGIRGHLQTPPPLWGKERQEQSETKADPSDKNAVPEKENMVPAGNDGKKSAQGSWNVPNPSKNTV